MILVLGIYSLRAKSPLELGRCCFPLSYVDLFFFCLCAGAFLLPSVLGDLTPLDWLPESFQPVLTLKTILLLEYEVGNRAIWLVCALTRSGGPEVLYRNQQSARLVFPGRFVEVLSVR